MAATAWESIPHRNPTSIADMCATVMCSRAECRMFSQKYHT
jgi:hypothetical protein